MLLLVGGLHQSHISYASVAGVIKAFSEMYNLKKGTAIRVQLRTEWQMLKMKLGENLDKHIQTFDKITGDLRNTSVEVMEECLFKILSVKNKQLRKSENWNLLN